MPLSVPTPKTRKIPRRHDLHLGPSDLWIFTEVDSDYKFIKEEKTMATEKDLDHIDDMSTYYSAFVVLHKRQFVKRISNHPLAVDQLQGLPGFKKVLAITIPLDFNPPPEIEPKQRRVWWTQTLDEIRYRYPRDTPVHLRIECPRGFSLDKVPLNAHTITLPAGSQRHLEQWMSIGANCQTLRLYPHLRWITAAYPLDEHQEPGSQAMPDWCLRRACRRCNRMEYNKAAYEVIIPGCQNSLITPIRVVDQAMVVTTQNMADFHREHLTRLLTCDRCRVAAYCSAKCQKADWNDHKYGECAFYAERAEHALEYFESAGPMTILVAVVDPDLSNATRSIRV